MKKSIGTREAYKLYHKEALNPAPVDVYLAISQGFAKFIMELLIKGETVKLPERLGVLSYIGTKTKPRIENGEIKGLAKDWKSTVELWKRDPKAKEEKKYIYFFNERTNGIRYKMIWSKKHVFIPNKDFYTFVLSRINKRRFWTELLNGTEYYVKPLIRKEDGKIRKDFFSSKEERRQRGQNLSGDN